jgi:hypothetical protein
MEFNADHKDISKENYCFGFAILKNLNVKNSRKFLKSFEETI